MLQSYETSAYLKHVSLYSHNPFYKYRVLFPEVLLLLQGTCCRVEDDDVSSFRIPAITASLYFVHSSQNACQQATLHAVQTRSHQKSTAPYLENLYVSFSQTMWSLTSNSGNMDRLGMNRGSATNLKGKTHNVKPRHTDEFFIYQLSAPCRPSKRARLSSRSYESGRCQRYSNGDSIVLADREPTASALAA